MRVLDGRRGSVMMPGLLSVLAVLALGLFAVRASGCSRSDSGLPVVTLDVAGERVRAEVASTTASRARGLMYRRSMPKNDGMLFVYAKARPLSFWMKNTYIPLDIAFIDADGVIRDIVQMKPLTTASHPSSVAVPYALEMNEGWFARRSIAVGAKVVFELPEGLTLEGE